MGKISILLEELIIDGGALLWMLVVKAVYYISSTIEFYFSYVWLFIFNTDSFEVL